jgi:hypothetical protein
LKFLIREIRSKEGVLHFKRWRLLSLPWFSIYIHGIYKEDLDEHLHDHPWNIWTIVLSGGYIEQVKNLDGTYSTIRRKRFHTGYRKADQFHKILTLLRPKTYTLAIVGRRDHDWGYDTEKGWVDHITYREWKNKTRDTEST